MSMSKVASYPYVLDSLPPAPGLINSFLFSILSRMSKVSFSFSDPVFSMLKSALPPAFAGKFSAFCKPLPENTLVPSSRT